MRRNRFIALLLLALMLVIIPVQANAQEVHSSIESAAAELRQAMVERKDSVTIYYQTDAETDLNTLIDSIVNMALMHTGVPSEGDYLFFHGCQFSCSIGSSTNERFPQIQLIFDLYYFTTAEQEAEVNIAVSQILDQLNLEGKSDLEKIRDIYDYVASHVSYDYQHLEDPNYMLQYTAYAALSHKTAVCQGYANLLYRLLLEAGVDCRIVTGVSNNEAHAWNIVKLDGQYYYLDATWDSERIGAEYNYFLKGSNDFPDHWSDDVYCSEAFTSMYPIPETNYSTQSELQREGDFEYFTNNGWATITKYLGSGGDVVVPAEIAGYPVMSVKNCAFSEIEHYPGEITSLTFSEGIRYVEPEAIHCCNNLKKISLPSTLVLNIPSLTDGVFSGLFCLYSSCNSVEEIIFPNGHENCVVVDGVVYNSIMTTLVCYPSAKFGESFTVPESVTLICDSAFSHQQYLEEVILPDNVEHIGYWAFDQARNLKKINIPENCRIIGQFAFSNTRLKELHIPANLEWLMSGSVIETLESITVDPKNPNYTVIDGVLYATNDEGVPVVLSLCPPKNPLEELVLPETVYGIAMDSCYGCRNLKRVTFSKNLQWIDPHAFFNCTSLEQFHIPSTLTMVGDYLLANNNEAFIYFSGSQDQLNQIEGIENAFPYQIIHYNVADPDTHCTIVGAVEPACGTFGYTDYTCSCGHTWQINLGMNGCTLTETIVPPTCDAYGYTHYSCGDCYFWYDDNYVDPLGHSWNEGEVLKEATASETGEICYTCITCGATEHRTLAKIEHVHSYDVAVTEPTCTTGGYTTYTCSCGKQYITGKTGALGHNWNDGEVLREPTENETGVLCFTCMSCGATEYHNLDQLEHYHSYDAIVTEPTCTEGGYTTCTCRCGDSYIIDETAPLGHTWSGQLCSRCDAVRPNPFTDIPENKWYFEPVLWAVENSITTGTSSTAFSPDEICNRAQVVTFLWRAMGKPTPASNENPFSDLKPSDYYYDAVLWAVETGITTGTGNGKFSPKDPCTRGQVVTFLWRAMGKAAPETNENPFTDVKDRNYFYQPVLWAVANGITSGTSAGKFSPDEFCTRGQVVTFLYRTLSNR